MNMLSNFEYDDYCHYDTIIKRYLKDSSNTSKKDIIECDVFAHLNYTYYV